MKRIKPAEVITILSKHMLVDGFDIIVDLEKSHGCYLVDAKTNREYLDFFTFFATLPVGLNHPKTLTPDFKEKMAYVSLNKPSNSDFYTVEMAEFVETFSRVAIPDNLPHLFLISGGTLAVENALKTAFDWKVRHNFKKGHIEEMGSKIIHFKQAFHGRSGYALSMTNTADPAKTKYFPKFNWPRVINPKLTFPVTEENLKKVIQDEEMSLSQIHRAIQDYPDDIAAIIIEPIQGEGGDNHFRTEFLKQLRAIADEHHILLIFDEVQSGLGVTGKMWAYQHHEVEPDIIAFGKKAQVCGILASRRIDDVENNVFQESSRINSTWGANLVDMVRSQRYLEIIEEERLVDNAAKVGAYFLNELLNLQEKYAGFITNVRGKGLFIAFDLPTDCLRNKFIGQAFELGMFILKCGERSLRFRPSLNITEQIVHKAIEIVDKCAAILSKTPDTPSKQGKGEL